MDEPFLQFEWHVAPAYHWQDWLDEDGQKIEVPTEGLIAIDSASGVDQAWQHYENLGQETGPVVGPVIDAGPDRSYRPMAKEHSALFRTFAALDYTNRDAILAFAATYGLLGVDTQEQGPFSVDTELGYHFVRGESHLTWAREICLMKEALQLAQPRTPTDEAVEHKRWASFGLKPPHAKRRHRLQWLFDVHLQHVQARMSLRPEVPPRLSMAPLTLLSAMWLQFALAVSGDKQFRECKFCKRMFEISTEQSGFRRHREFCSDSCKTKDYRRRKRTALRLAGSGTSVTSIAERTATDANTVRSWLAAPTPGRRKKGE